jgi:uncharacterized protein (TIGR02118 family)
MITRIVLAPRRAGLDIDEFQEHWYRKHGPLVARLRNIRRLRQHHAVLNRGEPLLAWPGFDACSEMDFDDVEALRAAVSDEHYPRELRQHSAELVELDKAGIMLAHRQHVSGAAAAEGVALMTFMRRAPGRMQAELAAVLSDAEQASEAHAREMYVAFELPSQLSCFDALEVQWFAAPEQVERYLLGCEARLHRHRLAHLVRGVERVISRVRTILG